MNRDLKLVLNYLNKERGFDFSGYRSSMVERRMGKRLTPTKCADFPEYLEYLKKYPHELDNLVDVLTINVSRFFRNTLAFDYIADRILPAIVSGKKGSLDHSLRVWSAGCATGEEPYSIAILIRELQRKERLNLSVNIFATDIDERALKRAKKAVYPYASIKNIKHIPVMLESGDQFVIYEDISRQKRLEAQLRQAQKMEAVGRLAGGVAHDFNNVLMTIMGYADLALMSLAEDDPLKRDLKEIKQGRKTRRRFDPPLLAFSRKQILQPVVLDLNELITGFVKMLERLIGEDVELETVLAPGLRRVEADPGQMEQVIMNLVINARDAMPGGGKLTIETGNTDLDEGYAREHGAELQPGPYVMFGVSDVGTGMDDKTKSLIFEPFFTTKEEGKGTGLGLSSVYGIVKQSGGYIWVYSEPGEGTTFKIYLPAVEGEATEVQKEQTSHHDLTGAETILIVEDDDALRKLACEILEPQGYTVLEAQNGIEALRVSEAHGDRIHLMIADVVMPKMGGRELAEHLRPLRPEMKVIYMSGYTDNAIVNHGVLNPEIEFLQKPITSARLKRRVREVLDQ